MKHTLLITIILLCVIVIPITAQDTQIDFRVKWDGKIIPGISFVSDLERNTDVVLYRSGQGRNVERRSPGKSEYHPIILKRPRSMDIEFERWANKICNIGSGLGSEVSLRDYRKDIIIELVDTTGRVLMAFRVYSCWPSKYIPLTKLDKDSNDPAMEVLVLEHEGWERDHSIY